jgi:hypothetical protein
MTDFLPNLRLNAERRKVPIMSKQTEGYIKEQLLRYKPHHCVEIGSAI